MKWPCIIKQSDDAELIYIRDQEQWHNDADIHHFEYDESDFLVDSDGNLYSLTTRVEQQVAPRFRGESLTLVDILGLIKAHAAQKGSCCVAKLYAPTINDAFMIVESLDKV